MVHSLSFALPFNLFSKCGRLNIPVNGGHSHYGSETNLSWRGPPPGTLTWAPQSTAPAMIPAGVPYSNPPAAVSYSNPPAAVPYGNPPGSAHSVVYHYCANSLLSRYNISRIPNKPIRYSFSQLSFNSMILVPPADSPDTRPLYHVSVHLNCFMPFSYITTIRRGATEIGDHVADFEYARLA